MRRRRDLVLMVGAMLAVAVQVVAVPAFGQSGETLFFSRDFPGSGPPYFEVELTPDGSAIYREEPDDEAPWTFTLREREARMIFGLVEKLDGLRKPIRSDRKVAFTGDKVFRYGDAVGVKYVYTEDADARALESWFLRMAESATHLFALERTVQFDRLGVNKTLLYFQTSFDKKRIVASQEFLPILRTIADGKQFVHIAQARAAALVERIESE